MHKMTEYQRAVRDLSSVALIEPRNRAERRRRIAVLNKVNRYCDRADKRSGKPGSVSQRCASEVNGALQLVRAV